MTKAENEKRAERAYRLALIYAHDQGGEDIEAAISDLSVDILHLADQYGIDQEELQQRALSHYCAERASESDCEAFDQGVRISQRQR